MAIWRSFFFFFIFFFYCVASWNEFIIAKGQFEFFNYMEICSLRNLFINYHTLSTPADLEESCLFSNRIIPNSSSLDIYIIIMLYRRHRYPWPSLATSPYRSSLLVGLQGHIPYPHIAAECMFNLVVLLLPGHMWGSIRVHHLWACPCFSSSVLQDKKTIQEWTFKFSW